MTLKRVLAICAAVLTLCAPGLAQTAPYVNLTGVLQSSNGMPASNYILSFQPSQFGFVAGGSVIVNAGTYCATSTNGSVVGVPNPLQKPPVTVGFTGTLPPANYYVKVAFYDASGNVTLASPETVIQLNSTGRLIVAPPTQGMPAGASGMKVYIATSSGTETLQGQSTGSASYLQSAPLSSGGFPSATNTTLCKQVANDAIIPTGTGYTVAMTDPNGNTIPGYPMQWQLMGAGTTINLSSGLPYYHGTVFFPSPIVASPPNHATQSISGNLDLSGYSLTGVLNIVTQSIDGIYYVSPSFPTVQTVVNNACNGINPGSVTLAPGTYSPAGGFLSVPSNCTLAGQGLGTTIRGGITTTGSDILIRDIWVNGSRSATGVDCIDIGSPATNVVLDGVTVSNCANQGILLSGSVSKITIRNGEVYNSGRSIAAGQGTAGIAMSGGTISQVSIIGESIHDSSGGLQIGNSGIVGQDVTDINISNSFIYNNAFDAILATIDNFNGGNIYKVRIENNDIYCNGWPANGSGFSTNCTAGLLQAGAASSGNGVGVDVIQQQGLNISRPQIIGNSIHDNTFEAVALSTNVNPTVSTSGTAVTWVAGAKFNTEAITGQWVIIQGQSYQIASVNSPTSLTLQTSAGVQATATSSFSQYMGALISGNISFQNGGPFVQSNGTAAGPGFYNELSDGNIYSANVAENAWLDGYINFFSSFTTYSGDHAFSDALGAVTGNSAGFNNQGGYGVGYFGIVVGSHATTTPIGVYIQNSQATAIYSQSINATTPLVDGGTGTVYVTPFGTKFGGPIVNTTAMQQVATTSCTTASTANAVCATAVVLPVAMQTGDTNYQMQCNATNPTANLLQLGATAITNTGFNWNIANLGSVGGHETIACLITHF